MKKQTIDILRNISPILRISFFAICLVMLGYMALDFQFPNLFRKEKILTDFDAFYVAGTMSLEGDLEKAYHYQTFAEAQQRISGKLNSFMPWAYPPPFSIITSTLAALPIGISYLIFSGLSLITYILVLRSVSPKYYFAAICVTLPTILLNLRCGQNGFLTGTLVGLSLLLFTKNRAAAGVPLGLMIIKPHLALGAATLIAASLRISSLATAFIVATTTALIASTAFGVDTWVAFSNGIKEASKFLEAGAYPLFRMTSIYATLHTLGAPPNIAIATQFSAAIIACAAIAYTYKKTNRPEYIIGATSVASLYISPYNYDYDLTLLGLAAAALIPEIISKAKESELLTLLLLSWGSCGSYLISYSLLDNASTSLSTAQTDQPLSFSSIPLTILIILTINVLRRPFQAQEQTTN